MLLFVTTAYGHHFQNSSSGRFWSDTKSIPLAHSNLQKCLKDLSQRNVLAMLQVSDGQFWPRVIILDQSLRGQFYRIFPYGSLFNRAPQVCNEIWHPGC